MAVGDYLSNLGSSLLGGVFDATGAATQAAIQGSVNTGVSQVIDGFNATIRQGLGTVLSNGSNQILDSIGLKTENIPYVGGILQNIAQSGVTSAATVFQHVIDGDLTLNNLPFFGDYNTNSILSNDDGVIGSIASNMNGLTDTMTAFVDYSSNTGSSSYVSGFVQKAFGIGNKSTIGGSSITSELSYASSLDNGHTNYTPKYKFLYIVKIQFINEFSAINNSFTFLIKHFERPKVTIEHDEVNFYSFRSMVPKRTVYQPFNLEIHDDIQSEAMKFVVGYLRKVSPIFNQNDANSYAENSMNYSNSSSSYGLQTQADNINVIDYIQVSHFYNFNATMDVYTFNKPKILEVTLSDLDMSVGAEGSSIALNIAYDGLDMKVGMPAVIPTSKLKLVELKANKHPKSLITADSNGMPINGRSITNLEYVGATPPSSPGSNIGSTIKKVGSIGNVVSKAINVGLPNPVDVSKELLAKQISKVIPPTVTPVIAAARATTGTDAIANLTKSVNFLTTSTAKESAASILGITISPISADPVSQAKLFSAADIPD